MQTHDLIRPEKKKKKASRPTAAAGPVLGPGLGWALDSPGWLQSAAAARSTSGASERRSDEDKQNQRDLFGKYVDIMTFYYACVDESKQEIDICDVAYNFSHIITGRRPDRWLRGEPWRY